MKLTVKEQLQIMQEFVDSYESAVNHPEMPTGAKAVLQNPLLLTQYVICKVILRLVDETP